MADIDKVIKALEHCTNEGNCMECVYYDVAEGTINCPVDNDALALLKSQQAEIERLTKTEEQKQAERKRKRQEYMKKYRSEHKEQAYQELKEWRKNNPEKWKAQKAREREKQRMRKDGSSDG